MIYLALNPVVEFIGPCSPKPLLQIRSKAPASNVGELTVKTLQEARVPFQGNAQGLNTAFNSPVGMDALEVVSDREMRSYGWCYKVDGVYPERYPDQYPITAKIQKVQWIYGYAHYIDGRWISQCEEAFRIKPKFLCKNSQ